MTTRYWLGTTSADFNTAANWISDAGASGVPADGDTLIFGPRGGANPCISASGDHWDQSAKNFAAIYGLPGFTGGVGFATTPIFYGLACGCDAIIWRAECSAYFNAKHASGKFDSILMESENFTMYVARAATSGKATDTARSNAGTIHFVAPAASQTDILNPDVDTLAEANGSTATIIVHIRADLAANEIAAIATYNGGSIFTDHPFTAAYAYGGTITYGRTDDSQIPSSAQVSGTLALLGGEFDWYMAATIKGVTINAGTLTAMGSLPKTLGDSTVNSGTIPIYGGTIDLSACGGPVTLGTSCEINVLSAAAAFVPQWGSQVTWSRL